jgi:hypothetical protein
MSKNFIQELTDEHSYEKKITMFRKTLPYIIGGSIFIIASMLVVTKKQETRTSQLEQASDMFFHAIGMHHNKSDTDGSDKDELSLESEMLSKISALDSTFSAIPQFELISLAVKNGNTDQSTDQVISMLKKIIYDDKQLIVSRNVATLEYIGIILNKKSITDTDHAQITTMLKSFDKEQPLYHMSLLYSALYNVQIGNSEAALESIRNIHMSHDASENIKVHADAVASLIRSNE